LFCEKYLAFLFEIMCAGVFLWETMMQAESYLTFPTGEIRKSELPATAFAVASIVGHVQHMRPTMIAVTFTVQNMQERQ